jgi:hypothetical protein
MIVGAAVLGILTHAEVATAGGESVAGGIGLDDSSKPDATVLKGRKLKNTVFSSDVFFPSGKALALGTQALDSAITLSCSGKGVTSCTYSAEQWVQVAGTTTDNRVLMCTYLDSIPFGNCLFSGLVPTGSFFAVFSYIQTLSGVAPGSHTVQTFVTTDNGGTLGSYAITYSVYEP